MSAVQATPCPDTKMAVIQRSIGLLMLQEGLLMLYLRKRFVVVAGRFAEVVKEMMSYE